MDMKWENPPQYAKRPGSGGTPGKYVKFAVELRRNPLRWAILPSESTSEKGAEATAHNIRRGRVKGFEVEKHEHFEVAVDETTIYVRFVEEDPEEVKAPADEDDESAPKRGEVRAWARSKGLQIGDRGAIPKEIMERYRAEVLDA